jgi:hypothetical protein
MDSITRAITQLATAFAEAGLTQPEIHLRHPSDATTLIAFITARNKTPWVAIKRDATDPGKLRIAGMLVRPFGHSASYGKGPVMAIIDGLQKANRDELEDLRSTEPPFALAASMGYDPRTEGTQGTVPTGSPFPPRSSDQSE